MVSINIANNQGITQAIASKLKLSKDDCKKIDLATWQSVLTEINNAESNTQNTSNNDSSIFRKGSNYTTDVNKIGDKSSYQSNFVVDKGTVEIDDNVWNKITQLLTGKTEATATEEPSPDVVVPSEITDRSKIPEQVAEGQKNPEVTLQNSNDKTKAEYDSQLRNMLGLEKDAPLPEGIKLVNVGGEQVIFKDDIYLDEQGVNELKQSLLNEVVKLAEDFGDSFKTTGQAEIGDVKQLAKSQMALINNKYGDKQGGISQDDMFNYELASAERQLGRALTDDEKANLYDESAMSFLAFDSNRDNEISTDELEAFITNANTNGDNILTDTERTKYAEGVLGNIAENNIQSLIDQGYELTTLSVPLEYQMDDGSFDEIPVYIAPNGDTYGMLPDGSLGEKIFMDDVSGGGAITSDINHNDNIETQNFDTESWEANSHVADGGNYSYSEEIINDEQGRTATKKVHGLVDITYSYDYSDDGSYVIKSDYDNSEEIYDTEGRLQRKNYPDGKKGEVAYNDDGSYVVKYTNKDGEYTSSLFYDKDGILVGRQESDKDYETVIHDAKTQTYRIGSQIFDEKQNLCLKDISENPATAFNLIYLDDGKQKFLDADGSYTICNKDGSVVEQYNANKSDKSFVVKYSDDGSYTNTYSDGTYETYNKDGLQIGCSDEDGSWSLTKADSNYFEFNIDDGNVNGQLKISISKDGSVNIAYDGENAELFTGINENAALNDNKVDIKGNLTDQRRLMVDILRLKNECCGLANSIYGETEISGLNGKLDIGSNQGQTGDCWLLAGINACKTRQEVKEALENLIELDNNGGAYVTLKGARDADGKIKPVRYHITSEELKSASNLSSGDGDERLFEIAMDKYIRDNAYQGISERFDIRGNDPAFFLNTTLNMETAAADYKDIAETEDFNNQDKVYTLFSTDDNFTRINAKSSGGESVDLVYNHAYTIKGEDENNVYLINPWHGEDTAQNIITVPKSDLLKSEVKITSGWLT